MKRGKRLRIWQRPGYHELNGCHCCRNNHVPMTLGETHYYCRADGSVPPDPDSDRWDTWAEEHMTLPWACCPSWRLRQ